MKNFTAYLTAIILIISMSALPVKAAGTNNATKEKQNINTKISDINKQQQEKKQQLKQLEAKKNEIINSSKKENQTYTTFAEQTKELKKQINEIDIALKESEERYERQSEIFKRRIRLMYENNDSSKFETIVKAKSVSDIFERLEIMSVISNNDKQLIDSIISDKKDVEYKKEQKQKLKLEAENKANDSLRSLKGLLVSRASVETEMKRVNSTLKLLEQQEDALIKKANELEEYIRNNQKINGNYSGGKMMWPVSSTREVSSYYGNRYHPILGAYKMHTGIDIAARYNESVLAANKGTVIMSGWESGYGNVVIIDHGGGISTLYGHCSRLLVSKGDEVKMGTLIAKVGSTGMSTGPHLHFEIRKKGATVNPLNYVK